VSDGTVPPLEPSVFDTLTRRVVETLCADMETLALDMVLKGLYPSQGWTIGVQWSRDPTVISYRIFPVPPCATSSEFPCDLI
jgi:hypothetical protein